MSASDACPDCGPTGFDRRRFLKTGAVAAGSLLAAGSLNPWSPAADAPSTAAPATTGSTPETLVKVLYETLTPKQKDAVCFAWDHQDPKRGLLRTFVANNWQITSHSLNDDFYTKDQRKIVRDIFKGMIQPDWVKRIDKQLEDDAGGFGNEQSLAIFGKPGDGKFEFVMTGRHMTLRCDGNSSDNVAFGGPIFYGHAADGFNEKPDHPGNVFWPQAQAANKVFTLLDEKQKKEALVAKLPREQAVGFQGKDKKLPGIAVTELGQDQQAELQKLLALLIEPYRQSDRDEALTCLKTQGGLEKCSLAFFAEGDLGNDKVWDNWRLEGPSFVWYFRGTPHVHVWVNIADSADVKTNA
ncbi:MAG: DUF3500 domain-containing protein [Pirellulales bacterium]